MTHDHRDFFDGSGKAGEEWQPVMMEIAQMVKAANPGRSIDNLERRAAKLFEEIGEIARAYLHVTSKSNPRNLTWDDVREEIVDTFILILDLAWTSLQDEKTIEAIVIEPFHHGGSKLQLCDLRRLVMNSSLYWNGAQAMFKSDRVLARKQIGYMLNQISGMAILIHPDQPHATFSEIKDQLLALMDRKLDKWANKRSTMTVNEDDI